MKKINKKIIIFILLLVSLLGSLILFIEKQKENDLRNKNISELNKKITLSNLVQTSSNICLGKIMGISDGETTTKRLHVRITKEIKGDIKEKTIILPTDKIFNGGDIYIFFLRNFNEEENNKTKKYETLSIASFLKQKSGETKIKYDDLIELDVDYVDIDDVHKLKDYIAEQGL